MPTAGYLRVRVALVLAAIAFATLIPRATAPTERPHPRAHATLGQALAAARYGEGVAVGLYQNETVFQDAYLKASNTGSNDEFGYAVAISGNTAVVGAHFESSNAVGVNGEQGNNLAVQSGAAYVFVRDTAGWSQQAYLKASNTGIADDFGHAVAISGDTIVVGAPNEGPGGAAYVFVRDGFSWTQQAYLKASNFAAFDQFGASVAVSGETIVVGAFNEGSAANGVNGNQGDNSALASGAAYVFMRDGTSWAQQAYLKASNTETNDNFGFAVGVSADTVVVGAFRESSNATGVNGIQGDNSASQAGAAYVFVRSGTTWAQQAYLKASNTGIGNAFGYSVSISGDTLVVGARNEASAGTGVNGSQTNGVLSTAGAAYVFERDAETWTQSAYLKAPNTGAFDQFAHAVAIAGNVIVAGAIGEDSSDTGVNGSGTDNSLSNSGAAYLYVRLDGEWFYHSYLKASNAGTLDGFGYSVAASGDTVVVGALGEGSSATGVNGDGGDNSASRSGAAYVFRFPNTAPTISGGSITRWPDTSDTFTIASVNDAQDGPGPLDVEIRSANPANGITLSNLANTAGTVTADVSVGAGASSASFVLRVTDSFGASADATFEVVVVPAVVITPIVTPAPNVNGWHNSPATIGWTIANSTDPCEWVTIPTETAGATWSCTAGNAGGSTTQSATVRIDLTPPAGTAAATPAANPVGWNNTDVLVTFTCSDALSGVVAAGASDTISTEGAGQSRSFSCLDRAGNALPLSIAGVNIDKTPPAVAAGSVVAAPNPVTVGSAVSLSAGLSDAGASNLASAEVRIDSAAYGLLASASGASATVMGSLGSFATADVVEACVRAVDRAGNQSAEECTYIAVFDPSAGYVTGAGTIESPPGALVGSTASGTARFGFQSKYAKGATVPTGNTSFKFRAGDLEFDSTSYDWLVVSGARAQYKGRGVLRNRTGTVDFILTVIDGDQPGGDGTDRFRIKITSPDGVVYDNQIGATDTADPAMAISGGHIVIRK